jgi:bifunctional DNase/RNase
MNKVRLIFKNVSEIVGSEGIGLIILLDEDKKRQLSIPCDKEMLYQFGLRVKHVPVVDKLLPEVMCKVLSTQTNVHLELMINDLIDGRFRAILCNTENSETIPVRASDAVLISMVSDIPLYMESNLMDKLSVEYHKESNSISLPVNTISDGMLRRALKKAIKDEQYELASNLRDELLKRNLNIDE